VAEKLGGAEHQEEEDVSLGEKRQPEAGKSAKRRGAGKMYWKSCRCVAQCTGERKGGRKYRAQRGRRERVKRQGRKPGKDSKEERRPWPETTLVRGKTREKNTKAGLVQGSIAGLRKKI